MIPKEDLWCPVACEQAEVRTMEQSLRLQDEHAGTRTQAESVRLRENTGVINQPNNPLFSQEIHFDPHLQVCHL